MANEFITPEGHTAFLAKKLFDGMVPHSIWNHGETTAKVIKISVER